MLYFLLCWAALIFWMFTLYVILINVNLWIFEWNSLQCLNSFWSNFSGKDAQKFLVQTVNVFYYALGLVDLVMS